MTNLPEHLSKLSSEKKNLLLNKISSKLETKTIRAEIHSNPASTLSSAQERMMIAHKIAPESSAYNICTALKMDGFLNVEALKQSLLETMQRHQSLRTVFQQENDNIIQTITPYVALIIPEVSIEHLPADKRLHEAIRLAEAEAEKPFNLFKAPLLRTLLIQLNQKEYVLVINMHHIISDGWSTGIIIKELGAFYTQFTTGKKADIQELEIQYSSYTSWQRKWLNSTDYQNQLNYWKTVLTGELPSLNFPTDKIRKEKQTFKGKTYRHTLPLKMTEQIREICKQTGTTLFMVLIAAYKILLHRYTMEDDIIAGTPIANRNKKELEGVTGFFVNSLAIRSNFKDNPSFINFLQTIKETSLEAYSNQDVPFDKVVQAVSPDRSTANNPVFQTMFILQNAPVPELNLPGIKIRQLEIDRKASIFDLSLEIWKKSSGLECRFEYNTDLFKHTTIKCIAGHYQNLLKDIIKNPAKKISELEILSKKEKNKILYEFNDTNATYPKDKTIHQLFEEQAAKNPNNTALVFEEQELTYKELNQQANKLARTLRSKGVKPDTIVGIMLEKSLEMIIGILGILKAGGAYLPLDAEYPFKRLEYMVKDSNTKTLLTQSDLLKNILSMNYKGNIILLDNIDQSKEESTNLDYINKSNDLIYLIYTSGSTGKPKGIMIEHKSIVNFSIWRKIKFKYKSTDKSLQLISFSFDGFGANLYPTILSGGTVYIPGKLQIRNWFTIKDIIHKNKITNMSLVPAMYNSILENAKKTHLSSLKFVILAGETSSSDLIKQSKKLLPDILLINEYGPSEGSIGAISNSKLDLKSIDIIGKPIFNTKALILDKYNNILPENIPGEICISGANLARGYLDKIQTENKFIPQTYFKSKFMYKTGDIGKWQTDGTIKYMNRIDNQVKIRGFRIELEEIKSILEKYPQINKAYILLDNNNSKDNVLLAFFTKVHSSDEIKNTDLIDFLKQHLPYFMVPSKFIELESFPLTINGKVDVKKLKTLNLYEKTNYLPVSLNKTESILIKIWQEILQKNSFTINDNFFDTGGNSLNLIEVHTRLQSILNKTIPVTDLYQYPTIQSLSRHLDQPEVSENNVKNRAELQKAIFKKRRHKK
ncbi:MAG: amino acid adenylation domain-containing protein [bacterium]|nr:amino acid adenylation domain-containing protein [bacterium]